MFSLLQAFSAFLFLCSRATFAIDLHGVLPHEAVLDPDGKYHLSWDFDDDKIVFEVSVETLGYVGLGLSPNGGMAGSDIAIGGVSSYADGGVYLSDCHATGNAKPACKDSEDWMVVWGSQSNTHTQLRFWRKLDTCDGENIRITTGTVRLIWAYHEEDWTSAVSKGSGYHGEHRGSKSVLLLSPQKELPDIPSDSTTMDFLNDEVRIPPEETTYWCQAFSMPESQQKEQIVKMEAVIQPGNELLVHHMILLACPAAVSNQSAGQSLSCFDGSAPPEWQYCDSTTLFGWAVGGGPLYLPENVGYPIGIDDSPKLVVLQTHYDNPRKRSGIVDSSGVRLTITRQLRQHDAGSVATGTMLLRTHFIPPYTEHFRTEGHCLPECLTQLMGNISEINIFASFPHAHLIGAAMKVRHVRNGTELKPIVEDNNYDFNYQEPRILDPEVKVRHGDYLITECTYNSLHRTNITWAGLGTSEEMCLNVLMFYPRIEMGACLSTIDEMVLGRFAGVTLFDNYNFTVEQPEDLRGRRLDEILENNINWKDKGNRDRLQEMITSSDNHVVGWCPAASSSPKYLKPPEIKKPFVDPDVCLPISGSVTSSSLTRSVYIIIVAILLLY